jgi:hypothetical protein
MSRITADLVTCAQCSASHSVRRYESFNADSLGEQVDDIINGTFERVYCGCGHSFQPEHPMLFTSFERKLWIVMHPPAERRYYAEIERDAEAILEEAYRSATGAVQRGLEGVRPQLVFGHHLLAEALRLSLLERDPAIVECAKLLWFRDSLPLVMAHPPFQLVVQGPAAEGGLRCLLHDVVTGAPLAEQVLGAEHLRQAEAGRAHLEDEYQALFTRPYISICRFLFDDTI